MIKRTLIALGSAAACAVLAAAPASAQQDVCVTYDFAGSELCALAETGAVVWPLAQEHDPCITYDFTGRQLCPIGDTTGYGWPHD
jgi:hypothetical protein